MNRIAKIALPALLAAALAHTATVTSSCESLASIELPNATITAAQTVAAGGFTLQGRGGAATPVADLPSFCRVSATLKPTSDSDIKIEVWLPVSGWNGKLLATGNGGWGGALAYGDMVQALRRGYATSGTDTGHTGGSASFALGHPEKLIDYAYRSEHEMTLKAKVLIEKFYGNTARYAYFDSCSSGGKQGVTEAQRYPNDYDGIVAGAPANYMMHLQAERLWIAQSVHKNPASYIPPEKYPVIHNAVLAACDALDGVKDGVIENPRACHFDPSVVACKNGDAPDCLTAAQVEAAKKIYTGAKNPRTGDEIFPGLEPGGELLWSRLAGPQPLGLATDTFKYVVFQDPNWDYLTLNFDEDIARADKIDGGTNNAIDANLKPFFGHQGKLLMYHGWSDQQIPPGGTLNYYGNIVKAVGGPAKASDSVRLFMVPGMGHCGGGDGPNVFDTVTALEQWVEKGKAPEKLIASYATNGAVDRTRPLCPYPQVAQYKGSGSTDDAANFTCKAP
ncbi:MAG TPA: tannase/feruloyl esterase family alpha/beta hydrolase [Bryobacteraceae bacterium]|jgi:feruloyl esterase|nr:tannase/feruloyl esterase family alpha/beta hydrolase [Bryobacteraceae bacterium]